MEIKIYDAAVIGAGASGLMAAITAARAGKQPILLEHMEIPAKKILATGNGKCNYTNSMQDIDNYYCEDTQFVSAVLNQFSFEKTIAFFAELGIRPIQKNGTCIYPESEQASSVRQALLSEIERLKIPLLLSIGIRIINKEETLFQIETKTGIIYSRTCILAAGGKAAKKTGSDGSGYIYAKKFGHTLIDPLPALTALQAESKQWELPSGIRIGCMAFLEIDRVQAACERGELQITDNGLSGIVIFQFSRLAARALAAKKTVSVRLDFKPDMDEIDLFQYLTKRFHGDYQAHKTLAQNLIGFLPEKMISAILKRASLSPDMPCKTCSKEQIDRLCAALKYYTVFINGTKNFDFAQAAAGGIAVNEICPQTMESRLVQGLFFAGEVVDVDAKCGGYNLQWAWASGYAAGIHAAEAAGVCASGNQEKLIKRQYDQNFANQSTTQTFKKRHREKNTDTVKTKARAGVYVSNPQTVHRRKKKK